MIEPACPRPQCAGHGEGRSLSGEVSDRGTRETGNRCMDCACRARDGSVQDPGEAGGSSDGPADLSSVVFVPDPQYVTDF